MTTRTRTSLRAALVALAALGGYWNTAEAQLTPAGTSIDNRATVNYSVGGQPQTLIESSPGGNTTPGALAGEDTSFLVDNRVDLTVAEVSGTATLTSPGALNAAVAFTVTNTGNAPQGYQLTIAELVGGTVFGTDNVDFGNLVVRVDEDPSNGDGTGNDTYDGTETATAIDVLNPGQIITVFVVSPTVPLSVANGDYASAQLQAQTAVPGTSGATLQGETPDATVNDPTTVEVVFADAGERCDGGRRRSIRDPVGGVGGHQGSDRSRRWLRQHEPARDSGRDGRIHDHYRQQQHDHRRRRSVDQRPDPGEHDVRARPIHGRRRRDHGRRRRDLHGRDAADADTDGCGITAGALTVGSSVIGPIAAGDTVTVQFQVQIN